MFFSVWRKLQSIFFSCEKQHFFQKPWVQYFYSYFISLFIYFLIYTYIWLVNFMLDKSRNKLTLLSFRHHGMMTWSQLTRITAFPAFDGSLLPRVRCFKQWIIIRDLEWYYQRHSSWFCSPFCVSKLLLWSSLWIDLSLCLILLLHPSQWHGFPGLYGLL